MPRGLEEAASLHHRFCPVMLFRFVGGPVIGCLPLGDDTGGVTLADPGQAYVYDARRLQLLSTGVNFLRHHMWSPVRYFVGEAISVGVRRKHRKINSFEIGVIQKNRAARGSGFQNNPITCRNSLKGDALQHRRQSLCLKGFPPLELVVIKQNYIDLTNKGK